MRGRSDPLRPADASARRRWPPLPAHLLALVCGLLCACLSAQTNTTRYVDAATGSDAADGLAATAAGVHGPKATIQAAMDASAPGDTVVVLPGVYPETVRFRGTDLLLTGSDPDDPGTLAATVISGDPTTPWNRIGVAFENGEGPGARLVGLTVATGNGRGIDCRNGSAPTLDRLILCGNAGNPQCPGGALACTDSSPLVRNTLIWGNVSASGCAGIGLVRSSPQLLHCTIVGNAGAGALGPAGGGVACLDSSPVLRYCILWGNTDTTQPDCPQIVSLGTSAPTVAYSCIQGGRGGGAPGATWLPGSFDAEPLFADAPAGNFRLQSSAGHWTGSEWAADAATSPCIDAGDPAADPGAEPPPNGTRLNLGFDGGTLFASRSPAARLTITTEPQQLEIPEGGAAPIRVLLNQAPEESLTVTVYLHPPVAGLAITSNPTFTLDVARWASGQTVVLSAAEDDADTADAQTSLWIEADGLIPLCVPVVVLDNDVALTVTGGTPPGTTIHERGSVVALNAAPPAHRHFVAWQGDGACLADPGAARTTIRLDEPATVTALTAADRHALVLLSPLGDPQGAGDYDHGSIATWAVTSPIAGEEGQRFLAQPAAGTLVMDADRVVAVDWRSEFLLRTEATGPGTVRPSGQGWYREGRTVTLTAIPDPGCYFGAWHGDVAPERRLQNPLAIRLDAPCSVHASFAHTPATTWAAVTVNSASRPGAAASWVPVTQDAAGGWQSDLSILVPPAAPPSLLAECRAALYGDPAQTFGGGFASDTPGRLPSRWQRHSPWPAEHCLVIAFHPPSESHTQALRLAGVDTGCQGLFAPRSALPADAVVQLTLRLPLPLPPSTTLTEFWYHRVGLRLRTDAAAAVQLDIENEGRVHPSATTSPVQPGQWNTLRLFLWSRVDSDLDGLDDGWERHYFGDLAQGPADDPDGDGLDNRTEYGLGTDPTSTDSDGDGMPDGWEYAAGLDPLADDAEADPDNDLIPNRLEAQLGTDPQRPDPPQALITAAYRLAAFWPFADSFEDQRPEALHMTPIGDAAISDGALRLHGAGRSERSTLPAAIAEAPARTLSLWFRADDNAAGPLLGVTAAGEETPAATISLDATGLLSASVRGSDLDDVPTTWTIAATIGPATWHCLALVCPERGEAVLYVDGEPVTPAAGAPSERGTLAMTGPWRSLFVGSAGSDPLRSPSFSGAVSALAWFTDALPALAIRQLYQADRMLPLAALCALDLDADGMPDAWEYAHFGSLAQGAQDDADGDGLPNLLECRLGCDPLNPDSDADGLSDGAEVYTHRTDPTCPDTDGDGLSDGLEVTDAASDPRQADTDGDGLPDGWEYILGLSPLHADSDGDGTDDGATDPDGDGVANAEELARGTNPAESDLGPATVSFATPSTPVAEAEADVQVTLVISQAPGTPEPVSVRVVLAGGTATPGVDFDFSETTVSFSPECLSATFTVRLRTDTLREPQETIVLSLASARGARLGTPLVHTIVISDALSSADDTDDDGLPDAWEMRYFGSLVHGADDDPDRDGLPNSEELRSGSRPDKPYRAAAPGELGLRVTGLSR